MNDHVGRIEYLEPNNEGEEEATSAVGKCSGWSELLYQNLYSACTGTSYENVLGYLGT